MSRATTAVLIALVVLLVITSLSMFTVDQRQNAIVFRLGEPVQVIVKPGLYFKMPLLDNVRLFDVRILTLDPDEPERFITSEKKNVLVDSFVKWRIIDVVQYYISVNGDESRAKIRLAQTVNDNLRAEFGKRTIHDVVSGEREHIMELMRSKVDADARKIGVRSLTVALTAALFTGMVLALQTAVNMARFGAENYVGPVVALSILRELGPVLTAILVGGKVASGITAELGSMKVTEQIDALRALGVNYIKKLVVPRLMAAVLVFPLVTILADGMGLFGGMLIAVFDRSVDPYLYWNTISYWVVIKDFMTGVGKSVVFGALVTLIGCYNGLATEGGTEGLGRSTTATVVQVAMGVIISDFFITKLFLFLFW